MKQNFPRCDLSRRKKKKRPRHDLVMPPPIDGHRCHYCKEASVYCVHKRKDYTYVCENCYRKRNAVGISHKKQWLWDHKQEMGCVSCGEHNPKCLDYHHTEPKKKKFSIGSVPSSIPSYAIIIEMRKCVVLCANCHRKVEAAIK